MWLKSGLQNLCKPYLISCVQHLRRQHDLDDGAACWHQAGTELGGCITEAEELQILLFRDNKCLNKVKERKLDDRA